MQQETNEIKEIIQKDIWGSVKEFLNRGIHLGEGEKSIHLTVGLLLLLTIAFIITKFLLKWLRYLFTRKMEQEGKLRNDKRDDVFLLNDEANLYIRTGFKIGIF